ncbi:TetR/AcrR family transcriptional regulator [Nocardioides sp. AN3]
MAVPTAADVVRTQLLDAAARLLAEGGPQTFSTRNVAALSGVSKMGIYTHFGSLGALAHAVVDEGFRRLAERIAAVVRSGDVRADLVAISLAFVDHARENPNLYRVMFGSAPLGRFGAVTQDEMTQGSRGTLDEVVVVIQHGIDSGDFSPGSAWRRANQWFCAVHGYAMLELSGFITGGGGPTKVLLPLLNGMFAGFATRDPDSGAR